MKILVADDEELARKRIIKLLREVEPLAEIKVSSSGSDAIVELNHFKPDLLFLDIQMMDMTGFEVLQQIDPPTLPIVIFVTAYDHFAIQAFEVQALDFLLKPYKSARFFEALHRGILKVREKQQAHDAKKIKQLLTALKAADLEILPSTSYLKKIVLKVKKRYFFVLVDQIKYIISSAYYAEIFTLDNQKYLYRISMTEFIQKLNPQDFIRINRSVILRISEIQEVVSEGQGDYMVVMEDGKSFSLTKNFKSRFLKAMQIK